MKYPKSELGKLQYKFFNSGLGDNPIITDNELRTLNSQLQELVNYMYDRGDSTMSYALKIENESVERMIHYRKN
jgi:hypothetical protein